MVINVCVNKYLTTRQRPANKLETKWFTIDMHLICQLLFISVRRVTQQSYTIVHNTKGAILIISV